MKALAVLVVALAFLAFACSSSADPESELPPREPSFNSVFFIDESRGWLTAYLGPDGGDVILKTSDGGETWDKQYAIDLPDGGIRALQFVDKLHGWAVVSDYRVPWEAHLTLLHTDDGGVSWNEVSQLDGFSIPQFVNENVGWGRTWDRAGADLMRTQDSGLTWEVVAADSELGHVCFSDELHGWTARTNGTALATRDGGLTWDELFIAPLELQRLNAARVWCQASEVAWVLLTGGVAAGNVTFALYRTVDGGDSWEPTLAHQVPSLGVQGAGPQPGSLRIIDADTAVYLSRCPPCASQQVHVLRTEDSGVTWSPGVLLPSVGQVADVSFANASYGWVVGSSYNLDALTNKPHEPIILRTSDGGETWTNLTLTFR